MTADDIAYFSRRLDEEQRRAASSVTPDIAAIHRSFASLYKTVLKSIDASAAIGEKTGLRASDRAPSSGR